MVAIPPSQTRLTSSLVQSNSKKGFDHPPFRAQKLTKLFLNPHHIFRTLHMKIESVGIKDAKHFVAL